MLAVLRAATSNTKTYANAGARADAMSRCHKVDALPCCSRNPRKLLHSTAAAASVHELPKLY